MEAFRHKKHLMNQQLLQLTNLSKKFDNAVKHLLSLDHDQLEVFFLLLRHQMNS